MSDASLRFPLPIYAVLVAFLPKFNILHSSFEQVGSAGTPVVDRLRSPCPPCQKRAALQNHQAVVHSSWSVVYCFWHIKHYGDFNWMPVAGIAGDPHVEYRCCQFQSLRSLGPSVCTHLSCLSSPGDSETPCTLLFPVLCSACGHACTISPSIPYAMLCYGISCVGVPRRGKGTRAPDPHKGRPDGHAVGPANGAPDGERDR